MPHFLASPKAGTSKPGAEQQPLDKANAVSGARLHLANVRSKLGLQRHGSLPATEGAAISFAQVIEEAKQNTALLISTEQAAQELGQQLALPPDQRNGSATRQAPSAPVTQSHPDAEADQIRAERIATGREASVSGRVCGVWNVIGEEVLARMPSRLWAIAMGPVTCATLSLVDYREADAECEGLPLEELHLRQLLLKPRGDRTAAEVRSLSNKMAFYKFFHSRDEETRLELSRIMEYIAVPAGRVVYDFTDESDVFYIVLSGTVACTSVANYIHTTISSHNRFDHFGDGALSDNKSIKRGHTATATTRCELALFTRTGYHRVLESVFRAKQQRRLAMFQVHKTKFIQKMEMQMFHRTPRDILAKVVLSLQETYYKREAIISAQSERVANLSFLETGECRIMHYHARYPRTNAAPEAPTPGPQKHAPDRTEIAVLSPGDCFGEACFTGLPQEYAVVACVPVRVLSISPKQLATLMRPKQLAALEAGAVQKEAWLRKQILNNAEVLKAAALGKSRPKAVRKYDTAKWLASVPPSRKPQPKPASVLMSTNDLMACTLHPADFTQAKTFAPGAAEPALPAGQMTKSGGKQGQTGSVNGAPTVLRATKMAQMRSMSAAKTSNMVIDTATSYAVSRLAASRPVSVMSFDDDPDPTGMLDLSLPRSPQAMPARSSSPLRPQQNAQQAQQEGHAQKVLLMQSTPIHKHSRRSASPVPGQGPSPRRTLKQTSIFEATLSSREHSAAPEDHGLENLLQRLALYEETAAEHLARKGRTRSVSPSTMGRPLDVTTPSPGITPTPTGFYLKKGEPNLPLDEDEWAPPLTDHQLSAPTITDIHYMLGSWSERWTKQRASLQALDKADRAARRTKSALGMADLSKLGSRLPSMTVAALMRPLRQNRVGEWVPEDESSDEEPDAQVTAFFGSSSGSPMQSTIKPPSGIQAQSTAGPKSVQTPAFCVQLQS
ncbi:hypothetical protein WJX72_012095 [[Myrmecia] bisecta]|uniref:Cyclic nucleotide-binding domain-containing protein n=1 Tax=[Myrmecia] bisecta TaxID=41462 RepID=A0AAW1PAX5_9CHLO